VSPPAVRASVAAALLTLPGAAQAHLVNSGLGPFYDGALHLLLSPDALLGLIAVALLAGLRGARAGRLTVIVVPTVWLLAGVTGMSFSVPLELSWLSIASFMVMGVLVAADAGLPPVAIAALGGICGALQGLLDGSALATIGAGPSALLGIVAAALVVALLTSAAVVSLRAAWARVAVRVAGSWVAAVGMLMLGWLVRGTG